MSIPAFSNKIKSSAQQHREKLIFLLILLVSVVAAFYLGYVARGELRPASQVVIQCPAAAYIDSLALSKATAEPAPISTSASLKTGAFVASKTGKKYYPIACSGANRIKDANKVYYGSAAAAQSAGLALAAGC